MKNLKNKPLIGHSLFFILGAWLVATIFIDFFAVMAVFKNVSSLFEAGTVGMYVFNSFNKFELFFGVILVGLSFFYEHPKNKIALTTKLFAVVLLVIAGYYLFFLSPMITELTKQMHELGIGNVGYETLQQTHQVYHKQYVKLDSFKMVCLLVQIVLFTMTTLKVNQVKLEESPQ